MQESRSTEAQEEPWAQTSITDVSPDGNPVLREIESTSIISANSAAPDVEIEDSLYQVPIYRKIIIDPKELVEEPTRDAESQTFLQGVPVVAIPIEYENQALQTMYTSSPCPPVKHIKDVISSMNRPMPVMKNDRANQTAITISPETSRDEATKKLSQDTHETHERTTEQNSVDEETIIRENLSFLLARVLWISEPDSDRASGLETKSRETQTAMHCDFSTGNVLLDDETQTKLTCGPRYSNSELLTEYKETKRFVRCCLKDCFVRGIETRIVIDDLLEEVVVKGASRLKYPARNQTIQTAVICGCRENRGENVLRKLKLLVVVDPSEGSIVIAPLMDDLVRASCKAVSRDARCIVRRILNAAIRTAISIGVKLAEIREQSRLTLKSIEEQVLDRRRKKIIESARTEKKESIATQTELGGVPEIVKINKTKEILCSMCVNESRCAENQEGSSLPKEDTKKPRTRDILLAYNPSSDYVIGVASGKAKNPHLRPVDFAKENIGKLSVEKSSIPDEKRAVSDKATDIFVTPMKKNNPTKDVDSIDGWTRIIENTLAKSWSREGSAGNEINAVASSATESTSKSGGKKSSQFNSVLSLQTTKALQMLKSAFCTRSICYPAILPAASWESRSPGKNDNEKRMSCTLQNCTFSALNRSRLLANDIQQLYLR